MISSVIYEICYDYTQDMWTKRSTAVNLMSKKLGSMVQCIWTENPDTFILTFGL